MKWSDVRQRRPSKYIQVFYVNALRFDYKYGHIRDKY